MKRTTRVRRSNPKRRAREFARSYGSKERVKWINALPCFACQVIGQTENAHLPSRSGVGRKGDARYIVPLCHSCHGQKVYLQRPSAYAYLANKLDAQWQTLTGATP